VDVERTWPDGPDKPSKARAEITKDDDWAFVDGRHVPITARFDEDRTGRFVIKDLDITIEGVGPDQLEWIAAKLCPLIEARMNAQARNIMDRVDRAFGKRNYRYRLNVPRDRSEPFTDEFFQEVAALYLLAVEEGLKPAPTISAANNVTPQAARGWIRQARIRGHLPPGRRGKVG
jgi:hypothetical protein